MTKIAFCSDVHLANHKRHGGEVIAGLNRRAREGLNVLATAMQRAEDEGCSAFVVNGDLLDSCKPEPQLLGEIQRIIKSTDMQVILLLGNHEQNSTQPGDHSLAALRDHALVVDEPRGVDVGDVRLVLLPFRPLAAAEYITRGAVQSLGPRDSRQFLVCAHVGVSEEATPVFLRGAHDSMDHQRLRDICVGASGVFVGNWHNHRFFNGDPPIYQTGALVPTGWDNQGTNYGMVEIYDSDTSRRQCFEVPGPRFLTVSSGDAFDEALEAGKRGRYRLYLRAVVQPDSAILFGALLDEAKKEGRITSGEVVVDTESAREQAVLAAHITRSASSLEEAIAIYVTEMPLDKNVSRENILQRLKGYLK